MFVRNAWYVAALGEEVGEKPLARTLLGRPLVLYRSVDGAVATLDDRCCHRGLPLSLGEVVDKGIQCAYHGLVFNAEGTCVHVPGQDRIPKMACVRHYPSRERNGFVWVWMGEPALAAGTALPVDPALAPGWKEGRHELSMCPIECDYRMVIDNLMDVTHVGYVHRKTIGGNAEVHSKAPTVVTRVPGGVQFTRWMRGSVPPPTYVQAAGFKGLVDRWQDFEFVVPAVIFQHSGSVDHGVADGLAKPSELGPDAGGLSFRILHAITPSTEGSCFYFWCISNPDDARRGLPHSDLFTQTTDAFYEDKAVLEAQEARLSTTRDLPLVDLASDAARVAARRALELKLAEEATHSSAALPEHIA